MGEMVIPVWGGEFDGRELVVSVPPPDRYVLHVGRPRSTEPMALGETLLDDVLFDWVTLRLREFRDRDELDRLRLRFFYVPESAPFKL